jgi:DNA-binding CsgD family transcriptional regulator/tetratricopeptide (TPR) repeat protein
MGTLVGRDAELARLRGLLHDAAAGRAVTGLVSGDAGIGKSRLVAEAMQIAERDGFTVLYGQCAEIGDSVPYLPFADAFRTAPPHVEKAVKERPVLSRLLPDGGGQAQEADWAGLARQQMFGAVLSLLSELAAGSPVLLVIEDLHWADATTRHLVTFLARMLHRERVAIIGTYRADDLHRRHPLRGVIAELLRLPMVALVELGPLSAAALSEILSATQSAPLPLSAATLNSLVQRAEGNAFYAEELLTASSCTEGTLPTGLAALLLSRVERLSDAAQQVLRAAAVAGGGAADDLVRAASGLPDDAYEEAVREAAGHQLLAPEGPDGYRFRHALLREAVYGDLMPGERTRLHARLASLLATVFADTGPGAAAELAHHSMASHDIPGAFAASVRAGAEAERLGAPAEAHRHYDLALELWVRVEEAEQIAGLTRGKLGLKSALAAAASGDVPRAVHLLRRIRDWVPGAAGSAESAELRSRVGERLAYHLLQSENKQWYAEALDVAEATVRETLDEPPTWHRARAMATYAIALMAARRYDDAQEWASRAREAARAAGSASVEADALATTGLLALRGGRSGEAIGLFTAAVEQAGAAEAVGVRLRAAYQLAAERLARGELAEAASVAHRGVEWAEAEGLGLAPFGLDLQHLHFQAHFADGCWDHAQELADGFPVRVTRQAEALLSAMALFVDVARGNPAVGERRIWLEPFWDDVFVAYIARGILAEHALWQRDSAGALAEAEAAIDADAWPAHSPSVIRVTAIALAARADRAAQLRAPGDAAGADAEAAAGAALLAVAREGASYPARPKALLGPEGRGWLARCEAEYARLTGANSADVWERVLAEFGPGYVYETARAQWRLAEALVEAGRRDEAAAVWRAARDTASRLRAAPLGAALDDLARRARLDPGTGNGGGQGNGSGGASPLAALTDREREVLRLLARGMSNREIGTELFIAPKTASVHVSNILGKLGAASRTEAAAIAYREGA